MTVREAWDECPLCRWPQTDCRCGKPAPPADDLARRLRDAHHDYNHAVDSEGQPDELAMRDCGYNHGRLHGEAAAAIEARDQRIAALEDELRVWKTRADDLAIVRDDLVKRAEAAERRAEADAADAKRYRIISAGEDFIVYAIDTGDDGTGIKEVEIPSDQLDAATDAAIAADGDAAKAYAKGRLDMWGELAALDPARAALEIAANRCEAIREKWASISSVAADAAQECIVAIAAQDAK